MVQLEEKFRLADDTDLKSDTPNDDVANKRACLDLLLDTHPIKQTDLKSILKVDQGQIDSKLSKLL